MKSAATIERRNAKRRERYAADPDWRAHCIEQTTRLGRERLARRLAEGQRVANARSHHFGMAALKASLGDPRPDGMTLSLAGDSPSVYEGYAYSRNGERVPYRLSTDPDDYVWETQADNNARQVAHL